LEKIFAFVVVALHYWSASALEHGFHPVYLFLREGDHLGFVLFIPIVLAARA
jgi:hypothetical protein